MAMARMKDMWRQGRQGGVSTEFERGVHRHRSSYQVPHFSQNQKPPRADDGIEKHMGFGKACGAASPCAAASMPELCDEKRARTNSTSLVLHRMRY